jgi:molybdate transport system substrate-binding protein
MAMSEHFSQIGTYVHVPTVYPEIRQCGIVLQNSPHRAEAHAFLDWLTSDPIQRTLPKLGLGPIR